MRFPRSSLHQIIYKNLIMSLLQINKSCFPGDFSPGRGQRFRRISSGYSSGEVLAGGETGPKSLVDNS